MSAAPVPYWRLSSFYFCYYAALGAFTPYFAQWLHDGGQDAMAISVLMGLWYATRIVAPALWTSHATHARDPIRWLRAGALLTFVAFAGFVLADGFIALFAVMAVFSFFCNAIMPQFESITLDTLGARRADYGRLRVWGSIGFIGVTLLFGWIIEHHGSQWLPAMMLPLFAAVVLSSLTNRMPPHHRHQPDLPRIRLFDALRRRGARGFIATAMLMQIGFGPFYVFFTLHLGAAGHGTDTIGALWSIGVLAEIAVFLLSPPLLRRFAPARLLLLCIAVTCLRWVITALFAQSLAVMVAMQLLHALSFGVFHTCCMQLVAAYFPGRLSAHGQALLYGLGSGIGGVLGAILAGAFWKLGGGQAAFLAGAGAALVGFFVALRLRAPEPEIPADSEPTAVLQT
jgi:MFS transporter, PPP family, 3-phenylpropionic acid transporter